MGKNRDRKSLIRLMANTIVHEIIVKHTNNPETLPLTPSLATKTFPITPSPLQNLLCLRTK